MKRTFYTITLLALALSAFSCSTTTTILAGASHACGTVHVEGYFTDTQGEVVVVKAPEGWTPEEVLAFCKGE